MNYNSYLYNTLPSDNFTIIPILKNGYCCYNSVLYHLKRQGLVHDKLNPYHLLKKCAKWIKDNKDKFIEEYCDTIENIVLDVHNLNDFEEYIEIYSKNNNLLLHDRWGGIPELIALSYLYNICINVYGIHKYNKNKGILNKGILINNKLRKDCRYKQMFSFNSHIDNKIHILWTYNKNNIYHFDTLIE